MQNRKFSGLHFFDFRRENLNLGIAFLFAIWQEKLINPYRIRETDTVELYLNELSHMQYG